MSDTAVVHLATDGMHIIWCPGCDQAHGFDSRRWSFNGDASRPTFRPSLIVEYGPNERGTGSAAVRCHSFITDGQIQFLADSTHALAGQTVDLQPW